jgi:hypothetical protein
LWRELGLLTDVRREIEFDVFGVIANVFDQSVDSH